MFCFAFLSKNKGLFIISGSDLWKLESKETTLITGHLIWKQEGEEVEGSRWGAPRGHQGGWTSSRTVSVPGPFSRRAYRITPFWAGQGGEWFWTPVQH